MRAVRADLNSLLQVLQNLNMALSEVERTKSSVQMKYRQLGSNWKDKKYNELGEIVLECDKALASIYQALAVGQRGVSQLAKSLQEYEDTTLGESSNQVHSSGGISESSGTVGAIGGHGFLSNIFNRSNDIYSALSGVEHRPIQPATSVRSEQQIISSISGGDMTEGSCSSLAFAYAGNRAGYVVFDFRDGQSRAAFSSRASIEQIANLDGVASVILHGTDDTSCAEQLMSSMVPGRQYYMATGAHAAVVRRNSDGMYQYLELQSGTPGENGWHPLTSSTLFFRFGCEDGQSVAYSNILIDLDSLQNNTEFLNLLGYINTEESAQRRGASGYVR